MTFFRDLFKGPGATAYELARVLGALVVLTYNGVVIGVFTRGDPIDFVAIGGGYVALLAGVGGFIWAKDTARTAAISQVVKDETAAVAAVGPAAAAAMSSTISGTKL